MSTAFAQAVNKAYQEAHDKTTNEMQAAKALTSISDSENIGPPAKVGPSGSPTKQKKNKREEVTVILQSCVNHLAKRRLTARRKLVY